MLESLMSSPYIWLILSICTIISIPLTIYTWLSGKQRKEISYSCSSNVVISVGKSRIDQLEILFSGKKINELISTQYYIWNSGNEVLHASDLVRSRPISIHTGKNASILDAQILHSNEETNNFSITRAEADRVEMDFDYVASGEGILLQLLHTGDVGGLDFDCKIKGGKNPCDCSNEEYIKHRSILERIVKYVNDILMLVVFFAVGFTSLLFESASKVPGAESEARALIPYVIWSYAILGVVLLARLISWHARHGSSHSIPRTLKQKK